MNRERVCHRTQHSTETYQETFKIWVSLGVCVCEREKGNEVECSRLYYMWYEALRFYIIAWCWMTSQYYMFYVLSQSFICCSFFIKSSALYKAELMHMLCLMYAALCDLTQQSFGTDARAKVLIPVLNVMLMCWYRYTNQPCVTSARMRRLSAVQKTRLVMRDVLGWFAKHKTESIILKHIPYTSLTQDRWWQSAFKVILNAGEIAETMMMKMMVILKICSFLTWWQTERRGHVTPDFF